MSVRFPAPLRPGATIGVTAPSSGVAAGHERERLDFVKDWLAERGYRVRLGDCLDGSRHVSAPRTERAAELTAMLTDPGIDAVVPPWGGETCIDLLDELNWARLADAEPCWVVGYSDISTLLLPLLLRSGWGSVHGDNLMDTPYHPREGLAHWIDVASADGPVTQRDSGRVDTWVRFEDDARATRWQEVGQGSWSLLDEAAGATASGILVGGCIETLVAEAGTPYGDVGAFGRRNAEDGLLVYLEACDWSAYDICRALHGMRLAGWFEHANGVLIGRTAAPDASGFTQRDAVADALGMLGVPVVLDLEIGHVPPHLPLVNGAVAEVVVQPGRHEITQQWVAPSAQS